MGIGLTSTVDDALEDNFWTRNPWLVIVESFEAASRPYKKPKSSCKHCHGRGWIGRKSENGEPIPCRCIFVKEEFDRELGEFERKPINRAERRKKEKQKK